MSYSRWSNSRFYTYWHSTDSNKRSEQSFCICGTISFTYQQLCDNIEECVEKANYEECRPSPRDSELEATGEYQPELELTQEEREELKGYMIRFIEAVKNDGELED